MLGIGSDMVPVRSVKYGANNTIWERGGNHSMSSRSSTEPDPEPVSLLAVGLKLDTVIEYGCNSSPTG